MTKYVHHSRWHFFQKITGNHYLIKTNKKTNKQTKTKKKGKKKKKNERKKKLIYFLLLFINEGNGISIILFVHPALGQTTQNKINCSSSSSSSSSGSNDNNNKSTTTAAAAAAATTTTTTTTSTTTTTNNNNKHHNHDNLNAPNNITRTTPLSACTITGLSGKSAPQSNLPYSFSLCSITPPPHPVPPPPPTNTHSQNVAPMA